MNQAVQIGAWVRAACRGQGERTGGTCRTPTQGWAAGSHRANLEMRGFVGHRAEYRVLPRPQRLIGARRNTAQVLLKHSWKRRPQGQSVPKKLGFVLEQSSAIVTETQIPIAQRNQFLDVWRPTTGRPCAPSSFVCQGPMISLRY